MKITIVTPTIREGFWNIMAHNLSRQTKKDFTWLIIDDYKEDRKSIADKYSALYGLDIQYARSKQRSIKRKYGLVNANNTVTQLNDAELFIWLQDFMLLEPNAVEMIAKTHQFYPGHLISCLDTYVNSKIPFDTSNTEDYFNNVTDVIGETATLNDDQTPFKSWRKTGEEVRTSTNHFEFEMNFCAIPREIITSLNGWWEFMDDGFGFDNTEFAYRALKRFKMIVCENIVATGINHSSVDGIESRGYVFNDPRFDLLTMCTDEGYLPIIRDEKIDDAIHTPHEIPRFLDKKMAIHFMRTTTQFYVGYWFKINFPDIYETLKES